MKKYLKYLWMVICLTFLYWVNETTTLSKAECVICLLLMCYIMKDVVLELWREIICEEAEEV